MRGSNRRTCAIGRCRSGRGGTLRRRMPGVDRGVHTSMSAVVVPRRRRPSRANVTLATPWFFAFSAVAALEGSVASVLRWAGTAPRMLAPAISLAVKRPTSSPLCTLKMNASVGWPAGVESPLTPLRSATANREPSSLREMFSGATSGRCNVQNPIVVPNLLKDPHCIFITRGDNILIARNGQTIL